jgi:hypothetical protein
MMVDDGKWMSIHTQDCGTGWYSWVLIYTHVRSKVKLWDGFPPEKHTGSDAIDGHPLGYSKWIKSLFEAERVMPPYQSQSPYHVYNHEVT